MIIDDYSFTKIRLFRDIKELGGDETDDDGRAGPLRRVARRGIDTAAEIGRGLLRRLRPRRVAAPALVPG